MIYPILNSNATTIKTNVNKMDKFFNNTAKCITGKSPTKFPGIKSFIKSLLENSLAQKFTLQLVNSEKVLKILKKYL